MTVAAGPQPHLPAPPARIRRPRPLALLALTLLAALLVHGYSEGVRLSPATLVEGSGRLASFIADSFPPDLSRLDRILWALLVTFEMALVGTILGIGASLPVALAGARNTSPHPLVYALARALVAVCRTIPDLVWGLIFVVVVGLGPEAGVLAIAADVLGFCGRFFAEAIEEVEPGAIEGMRATGASPGGILAAAIVPACLPSFVATSMFALESSTRSSVVLGLVGAGGVGLELTVAMQLLRYDEATTIIVAIFVVVFGVERLSAWLRRRLI